MSEQVNERWGIWVSHPDGRRYIGENAAKWFGIFRRPAVDKIQEAGQP